MNSLITDAPLWTTLLLGLLQGLTEFLPISSSGHLVLAQLLLDAPTPGIVLEVVLHAGTLCAVLVVFRRDLWLMARSVVPPRPVDLDTTARGRRELGLLVLATLPVVVVGLIARDPIEAAFENPQTASGMLIVTGILLLSTRLARTRHRQATAATALAMGAMQVLSLLPGISRSGATISGGLFAGGEPREMARFSFLMSVPAIAGSVVLQLGELRHSWDAGYLGPLAAGFLVAFVSGLLAIRLLLGIVARGRFFLFGLYCLLAGLVAWFLVTRGAT